jgi:hypothetical protein
MSQNATDTDAEALIGFLRERDVFCPLCRYNLRGLTVPRCPECGRGLQLSVGVTEPFLRAWITLAVSACSAAGIGILFAWLVITVGWPRGGFGLKNEVLKAVIAFFILMIPSAAFVIIGRRKFVKWAKRTQWKIAILVAVSTFVAFCLMLATVAN